MENLMETRFFYNHIYVIQNFVKWDLKIIVRAPSWIIIDLIPAFIYLKQLNMVTPARAIRKFRLPFPLHFLLLTAVIYIYYSFINFSQKKVIYICYSLDMIKERVPK